MQIIKGNYVYNFSELNNTFETVQLNEPFIVETLDCYSNKLTDEQTLLEDLADLKINPATGPIYVEGVQKGDSLSVEIQNIEVTSTGIMEIAPNFGLLGDHIDYAQTRILPIRDNRAILNGYIDIPMNKMIGVIGVAPSGIGVPCSTPGAHGGNLDTKDIAEGNTLHLPVFHDGGLLALGDLHAAMGDGELYGTGIEVAGSVTLNLQKNRVSTINTPIVETSTHFMVVSSASDFKDAVRQGMLEAIALLQRKHNLEFPDAYLLLGAKADLRISQLVNPKITIRIAVPKTILNSI